MREALAGLTSSTIRRPLVRCTLKSERSQFQMPYKIQRYGWLPDLPDQRDHLFAAIAVPQTLPSSVDFRPQCPPVYDQGQLGSCTGNAIGGAIQFIQLKEKLATTFVPSRLFIYY